MKTYKKWTQEEIDLMIKFYNQADPPWLLAERLGRTIKSVQWKLKGLRDNSVIRPFREVEIEHGEYLSACIPDDIPIDPCCE